MVIQPTLRDLMTVFFKRKRRIALTTLIVGGLGAAYLIIVTPQYRSESAVVVRFDQQAVPVTDMARESTPEITASNDRREIVQAHADILGSPDLAREVIESFGLSVAYPEIVEDPPSSGTVMDAAIYAFGKALLVDPEITGDVITVNFLHRKPELAQAMLNKLLNLYMKREAELFSAADFKFKDQQTEEAHQRLLEAQTELRDYKARWAITSFDDQITALIKQRADVSSALQSAEVALEQSVQKRDELTRLIKTVPQNVTNSANGEKYHSLDDAQTNLAGLVQKEQEMMVTYRADSPMLTTLRASIATARADVARRRAEVNGRDASAPNAVFQNIQTDLLRAMADTHANAESVTVLKTQLAAMDKQLGDLETAHTGLIERARAVDIADGAYRSLALHLEDARVSQNKLRDGISHGAILTMPSLPYKAAKPRYVIFGVAFAVAAVLAGFGSAIVAELMDDRFTAAHQVNQLLGVPVLATFEEPG